jgi:hypothetical protein
MTTIRVGDIVKRFDQPGSGTGILYRVLSFGPLSERYVRTPGQRSIRKKCRKVKIAPLIVMFDGKWTKDRNVIQHLEHDLEKVDIVGIAFEWNKLGLFLQDEARRLGADLGGPSSSPQNNSDTGTEATHRSGPEDCCGRCGQVVEDCTCK